jgi:hypothetical protein
VARAIVLLVAPGSLVFLDDVLFVLVDREASGHACLLVRSHPQAIEVERRRVLDDEGCLGPQRGQIVARLLVDTVRVRVCSWRQIDLGPRDVEKAEQVAGESCRASSTLTTS